MRYFLLSGLLICASPGPVPVIEANSSPGISRDIVPLTDVSKTYGRIQFVDAFPDYASEVVDALPDMRVQKVHALGDFKVQFVTSFPGAPRH